MLSYINKSEESLIINYEIGKLRCEVDKLKSQILEIETAIGKVGDNTLEFESTLPRIPEDSALDKRSRLKVRSYKHYKNKKLQYAYFKFNTLVT